MQTPADLAVIAVISNPVQYKSRYDLYRKFEKHMQFSGVTLFTVEMALGDRNHVVTQPDNPNHIQIFSLEEGWGKERMINIAIQRIPYHFKKIAWVDADISFMNPDWAMATLNQLDHYEVVQMFSHAQYLSPVFDPMNTHVSFMHEYIHNPDRIGDAQGRYKGREGHPGFAWAANRSALDNLGGVIDFGILGSGDRHMACALIGQVDRSAYHGVSAGYLKLLQLWQDRAERFIRRDVGYVPGLINHHWHGMTSQRGYDTRWKILVKHAFDPITDLRIDSQGMWVVDEAKIGLRDDIRKYLRSRNEDGIWTGEHKMLA